MKKIMMFVAAIAIATVTQAASIGWSLAGATAFAGDAYQFFVIGQNGADSIATITDLLDAGTDVSAYAFGSGTVADNGMAGVSTANSGKELENGKTYTGFYVVYDTATFTPGETQYAVVSGAANLTKNIGGSAASVTFSAGNQGTYLNNAANWNATVPEPTSALLLVLGGALLALRRKRA